MDVLLEETLTAVQASKEPKEMGEILGHAVSTLGFSTFAYLSLRPTKRDGRILAITNYPLEWHRHYSRHNYVEIDPVIAEARNTITPVEWARLNQKPLEGPVNKKILSEAADFGVRNGVTIPLHGPRSSLAVLTITADSSDKEFNTLWRNQRGNMHVLALTFHEAARQMALPPPMEIPTLSPREKECLLWTSKGKSAWAISEILGISEETVVTYLKQTMKKFDVASKHQAVVAAIIMGIIDP